MQLPMGSESDPRGLAMQQMCSGLQQIASWLHRRRRPLWGPVEGSHQFNHGWTGHGSGAATRRPT
jgi:hypothetical protein